MPRATTLGDQIMANDSKQPMFGRQQFLDDLLERVNSKGLTAVLGRSQSGKTTLLEHLRDTLRVRGGFLVGYAQSSGKPSLLRQSLEDLYSSWLNQASYASQLKSLWHQNKDSLVVKLGGKVGRILGQILGQFKPFEKPISDVISMWFDALESLDGQLKTGNIKTPTLPYDVANDLLRTLHAESGLHPVLMFDAFEQSNDVDAEAKLLSAIVRHLRGWPPLHLVVAARAPGEVKGESRATKCIENMDSASIAVKILKIPQVQLEDDPLEIDRLMFYLRDKIPCTNDIEPTKIVELIDGYGGVIGRWIEAVALGKTPKSFEELVSIADDAHQHAYTELKSKLEEIIEDESNERRLCIRIALLPELLAESDWSAYSDFVCQGMSETTLAHLQMKGILLKDAAAPSFGHTKRYEAARQFLLEIAKLLVGIETRYLIDEFASRIKDLDSNSANYAYAMIAYSSIAESLNLPQAQRSLIQCALTLTGSDSVDADLILQSVPVAKDLPGATPLVAMALYNTLYHAKEENKPGRRDDLLDELRKLAKQYPDDAVVRERLAKGLFNTLYHAKKENKLGRRDDLLDELRKLAKHYPDDAAVREQLTAGLYNTLYDAKEENKPGRRDDLLDELRKLAKQYPDDAAVRERLAMALFNTLYHAKKENKLERRDDLLDELRKLAKHYPDDAAVRERLAMALFNTLNDAKEENKLDWRDDLLEDLRELAKQYADDTAVRERLAKGLYSALIDAKDEDKLDWRDDLLDELRQLANAHPDDATVQKWLTKALAVVGD